MLQLLAALRASLRRRLGQTPPPPRHDAAAAASPRRRSPRTTARGVDATAGAGAGAKAAAAGPPRSPAHAAAGKLLLLAALAARVVLVYAWLWGLADFTFWRSTQACKVEETALPEIAAALGAARAAFVRVAGALQLGALP